MEASGCYPGSIGEIIQGRFQGMDILVSCPVNLYSRVKVFESILPKNKHKYKKSTEFLHNLLWAWGHQDALKSLDIIIDSEIPFGKGFASSTADLCSLYHALLKLFNKDFDTSELITQCVKIEPTDSIIFKEMTLFEYKKGSYAKTVGKYPKFHIVLFEGKNPVDTIEFNNKVRIPLESIEDLIPLLTQGVNENRIQCIAEASEESIIRNQSRLEYVILQEMQNLKKRTGGLGIIGAHSGNCLGIIYEDEQEAAKAEEFIRLCGIKGYKIYRLSTVDFI